jgi:hypothetical protein
VGISAYRRLYHAEQSALRNLTPWPPLHTVERGKKKKQDPCRWRSPSPAPLERGPGGEVSKGNARPAAKKPLERRAGEVRASEGTTLQYLVYHP